MSDIVASIRRASFDHTKKLALTEEIRKLHAKLAQLQKAVQRMPQRIQEVKDEIEAKWEGIRALSPPETNTEANDWTTAEKEEAAKAKFEAAKKTPVKGAGRPPLKAKAAEALTNAQAGPRLSQGQKLSYEQEIEILELLTHGATQRSVTERLNVSQTMIGNILKKYTTNDN